MRLNPDLDTAALGILELRAKARRLKAEHNVGLVIVDYLQLMQGPRNAENREKEISAISRSLKALESFHALIRELAADREPFRA
jgi:replicative DNA helicase